MKKSPEDIIILHVCKNKVPEMWCATDGPTAKVTIEVGAPPKKLIL